MLINFLKFFHILLTLGLIGSTFYCLLLITNKKFFSAPLAKTTITLTQLNKIILTLLFFAVLTGTFLVYPKNFTFHTPWIQAAYLFVFIFGVGIFSLIIQRNKLTKVLLWRATYLFLILILIGITHDAVTKSSLLFE